MALGVSDGVLDGIALGVSNGVEHAITVIAAVGVSGVKYRILWY